MSKGSPLGGVRNPLAEIRSQRLGRLVVSGLLALPLLADVVAEALGFEIFYLADAKLQAVWGTLAQFVAGWPLYGEAIRYLRRTGGSRRSFSLILLSLLLYGVSLYAALVAPGTGVLFLGSALLIVAAHLADYLDVRQDPS
ncbi:MAG: hypothetical protein ACOY93_00785 [Bacillota bacterium]